MVARASCERWDVDPPRCRVIQLLPDEGLQQFRMDGSVCSQHYTILDERERERAGGERGKDENEGEGPAERHLITEVVDGLGWEPSPPEASECEQPRIIPVTGKPTNISSSSLSTQTQSVLT